MTLLRTSLLIACCIALGACGEGNAKKKSEAPPIPVLAARAGTRDIPVVLQVVGRAEAFESVQLKARIDGVVASIRYAEGQHVNRGDELLRLDPADFAAKLQQAEANAARDEALIAKSKADTARYVALKDRQFVSEEKVNDVRTAEAAAAANLHASRAAVDVARLQLSYAVIRAPISGVIGARLVAPGSAVKTNDTMLAVINRVSPLLVSFAVPEKHLGRLREAMQAGGMKVGVRPTTPDAPALEGKVSFIDNAVDMATGTILVKAELENTDEKLTPGQFLNVSLILDTLRGAVTVPNEAVQQGADGNFLYVVKDDQSVEMRKVDAAASDGGVTAIRSGLSAGELVVTDGQLRLTPDAKVKVKGAGDDKSAGAADKIADAH